MAMNIWIKPWAVKLYKILKFYKILNNTTGKWISAYVLVLLLDNQINKLEKPPPLAKETDWKILTNETKLWGKIIVGNLGKRKVLEILFNCKQ